MQLFQPDILFQQLHSCFTKASAAKTPAQDYLQCGQIDEDVPVQSARSHQSVVQDVCPVRGSEDYDVVRRPHSCRGAQGF